MKLKRILIAIRSLGGGGAEKVLIKVLEKLPKDKYEIDLLLLEKEGVYVREVEKKFNLIVFDKKIVKLSNVKWIRKIHSLYRHIRWKVYFKFPWLFNLYLRQDYDVEIAFLEGLTSKVIAARKNKAKKIAWIHTDLKKHRILTEKEERAMYKAFDRIVVVSKGGLESFVHLYPEYQSKCQVIYNPIDKVEILEKAKQLECNAEPLTIIAVGRLTYAKGYDILLKAVKELIDEGIIFKLLILGEGEERKNLEDYILDNQLNQYVKLAGFCENPYRYINSADIFIVSSRYEGYPLGLCEALVLGKPVIATACTGPVEILENNKYGMVVKVEDVNSLKQAIKKMCIKEEVRIKYANLARQRARLMDIDVSIKQIENLLNE